MRDALRACTDALTDAGGHGMRGSMRDLGARYSLILNFEPSLSRPSITRKVSSNVERIDVRWPNDVSLAIASSSMPNRNSGATASTVSSLTISASRDMSVSTIGSKNELPI
nr:hypothetical protein [Burkholderia stagnalis]